jgi:hypothetical protein
MRDRFYDDKSVRKVFTEQERKMMFDDCPNCVTCKKKVTLKSMNIDHVIPLACGGTNEPENLQILCKKCHFAKTKEEHENGYIKLSHTQSSFNQQTLDVFTSSLSCTNAFVETLEQDIPLKLKASKVYHFDINRCRKNMIYHSSYEFPLFTVMDSVVPFEGDYSRPGRYYIECDQGFPIRGNGWYYQPMIEYLVSIGKLNVENIRYVVYASCSIRRDYFNDFIRYLHNSMGDYAKLAVNAMIGSFKPKLREHWRSTALITDQNEAFYHFLENNACYVDAREIGEEWFYQVFEKSFTSREETEMRWF